MISSKTLQGYIAGLLAALFWGVHSVIIRNLTGEGVSPFLIAGLRLYIGIITILVLLTVFRIFRKGKITNVEPVRLNYFFWLAAFSLGINFLLFQWGLHFTLASDANLIQNFSPVAVLLISSIFLGHRVREIAPNQAYWRRVLQIVLIGSIGASFVLINDANNVFVSSHDKLSGDVIEFAAMIFFAIFVICSSEFTKTHSIYSSLKITMMTLAVAAIPVTLFVPFGDIAKLTAGQWQWILFIGVFSTGFAYFLWHVASKRLNIIPLSLNLVYIGIITVLTEFFFLKLIFGWEFIVGGLLMIGASVAAEMLNSKAKEITN